MKLFRAKIIYRVTWYDCFNAFDTCVNNFVLIETINSEIVVENFS